MIRWLEDDYKVILIGISKDHSIIGDKCDDTIIDLNYLVAANSFLQDYLLSWRLYWISDDTLVFILKDYNS